MPPKTKTVKLKSADYLYFSRCGRYLATSKVQGRIHLYTLPDCALSWAGKPLKNIDMLAFSPCTNYLSVSAEGGHWCVLKVADGSVVLTGRSPRQTHGVYTALHFLPDGTGLFVIDAYDYFDKDADPPRWAKVREASQWGFPDGALQGVHQLDLPFNNCQVFQSPTSGRYVMLHTLPALLEDGHSTVSYAVCTWTGSPLAAEMADIPPPESARAPDKAPGKGRWKSMETIRFAADGDMALLLYPGYASPGYALLLADGETFAERAFTLLPILQKGFFLDSAVGTEVVAAAYYEDSASGIYFYRRADLSLIGHFPYPERISRLAFHPGGTGLAVAAGAKSLYYPGFPQSEAGLSAWLGNAMQ